MNRDSVFYNIADVIWTRNIFVQEYNAMILDKIFKVRAKMDFCDDIHHREKLARQLSRLKKMFIRGR